MTAEPDSPSFQPNRFWQVGVLVSDIDAAMEQMSAALGLTWGAVKTDSTFDSEMKVVFSRQGPPFFELIQGAPGSQWDVTNGSKLDHLAYWVADVEAERERLVALGAEVVVDGPAKGLPLNYHLIDAAGFRIEVFDESFKDRIRASQSLDDVG
jgi:predicted enzyme related to lactoylglutathione lyase